MYNTELKITEYGSHTLFVPELNETYHSKHGAIQESMHVFINAGLGFTKKSHLSILEIGFGTGLNALLTLLAAEQKESHIDYDSLEAFPLDEEIVKQLNYPTELKVTEKETKYFENLHAAEWEHPQKITAQFNLTKHKIDLASYQTTKQFDIIYFDAFAPDIQPELWEKAIFENMYKCLVKNGVLVTYCAKGSVKRILKEVGFTVENIPGPPGKREMTRAVKNDY